jgi:uracil-DNA glycosylase
MEAETGVDQLITQIRACVVCASHLAAGPRPIVQFSQTSRLLIIGQAPGARVHASGVPWDDASGDRLRDWTGLTRDVFYNPAEVALVPMGFCYPGTGPSGDLPPRPECAPLWHERILASLPSDRLTLLVGSYAQKHYIDGARRQNLTEVVRSFAAHGPAFFPLPHPYWRSGIWMRRNPWFERDLLPFLREQVRLQLT